MQQLVLFAPAPPHPPARTPRRQSPRRGDRARPMPPRYDGVIDIADLRPGQRVTIATLGTRTGITWYVEVFQVVWQGRIHLPPRALAMYDLEGTPEHASCESVRAVKLDAASRHASPEAPIVLL